MDMGVRELKKNLWKSLERACRGEVVRVTAGARTLDALHLAAAQRVGGAEKKCRSAFQNAPPTRT